MEIKLVNRFLALNLVFLLIGCASVDDVKPPTIQLSNLTVRSAGLLSQELLLEIRIGNPNDFSLPLTGLTFQMDVNGSHFADGLSDKSVTVPRLGYATLPVTGNTDTLSLIRQLTSLGNWDRISYRLHGTAYVGSSGQNTAVQYDRKGELSLQPGSPENRRDGLKTLVPITR